jgi:hypothetical protein
MRQYARKGSPGCGRRYGSRVLLWISVVLLCFFGSGHSDFEDGALLWRRMVTNYTYGNDDVNGNCWKKLALQTSFVNEASHEMFGCDLNVSRGANHNEMLPDAVVEYKLCYLISKPVRVVSAQNIASLCDAYAILSVPRSELKINEKGQHTIYVAYRPPNFVDSTMVSHTALLDPHTDHIVSVATMIFDVSSDAELRQYQSPIHELGFIPLNSTIRSFVNSRVFPEQPELQHQFAYRHSMGAKDRDVDFRNAFTRREYVTAPKILLLEWVRQHQQPTENHESIHNRFAPFIHSMRKSRMMLVEYLHPSFDSSRTAGACRRQFPRSGSVEPHHTFEDIGIEDPSVFKVLADTEWIHTLEQLNSMTWTLNNKIRIALAKEARERHQIGEHVNSSSGIGPRNLTIDEAALAESIVKQARTLVNFFNSFDAVIFSSQNAPLPGYAVILANLLRLAHKCTSVRYVAPQDIYLSSTDWIPADALIQDSIAFNKEVSVIAYLVPNIAVYANYCGLLSCSFGIAIWQEINLLW